jgi:hypothetical protein
MYPNVAVAGVMVGCVTLAELSGYTRGMTLGVGVAVWLLYMAPVRQCHVDWNRSYTVGCITSEMTPATV